MWCLSVRSHFLSGYLWDTMLLTPVDIQQEYRLDQSNVIGRWLRHRRRIQDLTQAQLAAQAECAFAMLKKIEAGARTPSPRLIGRKDHLVRADTVGGYCHQLAANARFSQL